jgi:hypothetical protein
MTSLPITGVYNDGHIAELLEQFRRDPNSVDESWRQFLPVRGDHDRAGPGFRAIDRRFLPPQSGRRRGADGRHPDLRPPRRPAGPVRQRTPWRGRVAARLPRHHRGRPGAGPRPGPRLRVGHGLPMSPRACVPSTSRTSASSSITSRTKPSAPGSAGSSSTKSCGASCRPKNRARCCAG